MDGWIDGWVEGKTGREQEGEREEEKCRCVILRHNVSVCIATQRVDMFWMT